MTRFNGPYVVKHLDPDQLCEKPQQGTIYIEYNSDNQMETAVFLCPCNEVHSPNRRPTVRLNLDKAIRSAKVPAWSYLQQNGLPTISPSILWTDDKACHFFIRDGYVKWC